MMNTTPGHHFCSIAIVAALLTFHAANTASAADAKPAAAATDIKLLPMDEAKLKAELPSAAKGTIVNLWASWCEPCKREMPELIKLAEKERAKGIKLMLVSGDTPDEAKEAAAILAQQKIDFPVYILKEAPDVFMKNFVQDWPAIVPTTLLFDHSGKRVASWLGEIKMKELEAAVAKLTAAKAK